MKNTIAMLMLGAFLATSVVPVMAQEKPKKECRQDSSKCKKHEHKKCCKEEGNKGCCKNKK